MMRTLSFITIGAGLFACALASAQQPPGDAIQSKLFPPEFIIKHREELELSEAQLQGIRAHVEDNQRKVQEAQRTLAPEVRKLSELLDAETVDEAAVLAQLEKVLEAERAVKRTHLQIMIRVRNELTPEQRRALAKKLRATKGKQPPKQRLHAKLQGIQQEFQRRARAGQPAEEAMRLMPQFEQAIRAGRHEEAEAVLDRILKMLGQDGAGEAPREPQPQEPGEKSSDAAPAPLARVPVSTPLDVDVLRKQVSELKREDVAWRKIAWKTCLIEGLKASRAQNKPIILWVFIDRPIDDERC